MPTRMNRNRFRSTRRSKPPSSGFSEGGHLAKEDGFNWIREAQARTRQIPKTVRETEELHRLLFEKVPHPRFVCDARTLRILVVNEAAVRRYGYTRDEF